MDESQQSEQIISDNDGDKRSDDIHLEATVDSNSQDPEKEVTNLQGVQNESKSCSNGNCKGIEEDGITTSKSTPELSLTNEIVKHSQCINFNPEGSIRCMEENTVFEKSLGELQNIKNCIICTGRSETVDKGTSINESSLSNCNVMNSTDINNSENERFKNISLNKNIEIIQECNIESPDHERKEELNSVDLHTSVSVIVPIQKEECSTSSYNEAVIVQKSTPLVEGRLDSVKCDMNATHINDPNKQIQDINFKSDECFLKLTNSAGDEAPSKGDNTSDISVAIEESNALNDSNSNTVTEGTENICSNNEIDSEQASREPEIIMKNECNKERTFQQVSIESKDSVDKENTINTAGPSINSNINTVTTTAFQDSDNHSQSENDSSEVMVTEIENCNEIELVDLNENELQKEKDINQIGADSNNTEQKNDEFEVDTAKLSFDKLKLDGTLRMNSETVEDTHDIQEVDLSFNIMDEQPDASDRETITGDTGLGEVDNQRNKDENVCIVPDDMSTLLTLQNKAPEHDKSEGDNEIAEKPKTKIIATVVSPDVKLVTEKPTNENNDSSKSRPTRNAAKLAGNKIRSLVLNDIILEQQRTSPIGKGRGESENIEQSHKICAQCKEVKLWKFLMVHGTTNEYLCSEECSEAFAKSFERNTGQIEEENTRGEFRRNCAHCHSQVTINETCLYWETMDFCNEDCLGQYQIQLGSNCANCKGNVLHTSLGKYCVRFGCDIKQFCSVSCLEEYKKGMKVCSYCQKDISKGVEGFLAPVGDKGQFKDFCTQSCMEKYEQICNTSLRVATVEKCAVCDNCKQVQVEFQLDNKTQKLCSEPCFAAFKFVNNVVEGLCNMCKKYFDLSKTGNYTVFCDKIRHSFCCKTCMNIYILNNRKIVQCNWCKVKKYNFDMIRKGIGSDRTTIMCSLNCLTLHQLSLNSSGSGHTKCDLCLTLTQTKYYKTMADSTIRNFCSYTCAMSFEKQYSKQALGVISGNTELSSSMPTGTHRRPSGRKSQIESPCGPIISSVQSLASSGDNKGPIGIFSRADTSGTKESIPLAQPLSVSLAATAVPASPPQIYQQIITKPPPTKIMKNKSVLCKPYSHTKGVSCRPHPCIKETQTDQSLNKKFLIPIPVPIYVPAPMHMFATPFPVPVPFPLPVPVPIFIPTTRNSAKGIFKEIKKIQEKIPTDPFEAELLMMAEMVAGEKKQDQTDSESEECNDGEDGGDGTFSPENVDASTTFGDDMLQMALKMASELEEPAVDMESVLTSNTITSSQPPVDPNKVLYDQVQVMTMNRGRKRSSRGGRNTTGGTPSKRGRRTSASVDVPLLPPSEPIPPQRIEVEKPDADMCLKYTFGVNAWRHWVMQKNAELEKVAMTNRKIKLFKPELLQLTADELNFSLCLFVKEVRKPNGTEYAPDTIYYLCLGIQQYLFENGRIDNIFTDTYYEKFTDCLDEVAKKFAALYNDSQYIVTRVEEEHLWESKQLGAHSPHVLLSTLMFFNTKHFNLVTVEEHMQLSFSHIMKHWKRNPNNPGVAKVPGSRNVLLRFYPPQSALEANSRKKKVYEQQENEENPLRCPVKLYEFYLSKCPESVKTRNDVFYLLPERSCVPDSPVWYSTMALGKEPLMKMLHRVKMVKEINIALLSC